MSSQKKDNVKRDDDMTTSNHTRNTAGGGRGIFSNTNRDVSPSILHPRHTINTHHHNDNFHYQHDHNHVNGKRRKTKPQQQKKEKGRKITLRNLFDMVQKKERYLNNGDRFDELHTDVEDWNWDAVLLDETWRQAQKEIWKSQCGHI